MRDQPFAESLSLSFSLCLSFYLSVSLSVSIKDARAFTWSVFELSRIGFSSSSCERITVLFVYLEQPGSLLSLFPSNFSLSLPLCDLASRYAYFLRIIQYFLVLLRPPPLLRVFSRTRCSDSLTIKIFNPRSAANSDAIAPISSLPELVESSSSRVSTASISPRHVTSGTFPSSIDSDDRAADGKPRRGRRFSIECPIIERENPQMKAHKRASRLKAR